MQTKKKTNLHFGADTKKLLRQIRQGLMTLAIMASTTMACFATEPAETAAGEFASSNAATGTMALIHDLTLWLTALGPIVGGLFAIWFTIRRSMADETDGKQWTKRIITAVICGVGVMLISGIIAVITGYYV